MTDYLTDDEVNDICAGLRQNAARVRFLRGLGYHVERRPNGRPLVRRQVALPGRTIEPAAAPRWTR